jgi:hypothetical protein
MRKNERLRLLEMQLLRLEFEVELLNHMLSAIMEQNGLAQLVNGIKEDLKV